MVKTLRKMHLQVWTLLAFLIPLGIISAYIVVPEEVFSKLLQEDVTAALPVVIYKTEEKNHAAYLRSTVDRKNYQLQWINTHTSTWKFALIYQLKHSEKQLIGRIGSTGSYYFPLKADTANRYDFILYDIFLKQTIDTIKF